MMHLIENFPSTAVTAGLPADIAMLRRMACRNIFGDPICYAFGTMNPEQVLINEDGAPDWLFEIEAADGRLLLTIDVYNALRDRDVIDGDWEVDAWEEHKICITAPATRAAFYQLSQTARTLLGGNYSDLVALKGSTGELESPEVKS